MTNAASNNFELNRASNRQAAGVPIKVKEKQKRRKGNARYFPFFFILFAVHCLQFNVKSTL
jgi:hypothetical protein